MANQMIELIRLMLLCVLHDTANYEYNKTISLMCNEIIDNIIEKEKI